MKLKKRKESLRISLIKKSKLFDAQWYLANNPDVLINGIKPEEHYYKYGWKENRDPSEQFITSEYFQINPDIKAARICPLYHYESSGKFEGRNYRVDIKDNIYFEPTEKEWKQYKKRLKKAINKEKSNAKEIKIDNKKILFKTFQSDYTCNPKYICEEILKRKLDYDIVWICKDIKKVMSHFPSEVRLVQDGTIQAKHEIYSAKVLVDNGSSFFRFSELKKKGQVSLCTWHGSLGFKKLIGNKLKSKKSLRTAKLYGEINDYVISNSTFEDKVFRESYWPYNKFIKCGHPRNDILVNNDADTNRIIKNKVYKNLGIDFESKILLYAPTFREKLIDGSSEGENNEYVDVDYIALADILKEKFGGNWIIIMRVHFVNASDNEYMESLPDICVNGTDYPDIQELMVAADVALTDYSSWILDFMFTKKPAFLYTPDCDEYELQRGFYYPLQEAPFDIAKDNKQLAEIILSFDEKKYIERVDKFLIDKGSREDGNGSKVVADKIISILGK